METGAAVINALSGVSPAGEDKDDGRRRREKGRHARNSRKFLTIQGYFSAISSTFTRTCVTRRRTCILPLIRPTSVNSSRMDKPSRKLTSGSRYTHTSAVQRAGELWTAAMKLMGKKKRGGGEGNARNKIEKGGIIWIYVRGTNEHRIRAFYRAREQPRENSGFEKADPRLIFPTPPLPTPLEIELKATTNCFDC